MNKNETFENFFLGIASVIALVYIFDVIFNDKTTRTKKKLPSRINDGFTNDAHSLSMDRLKIGNDFYNAKEALSKQYEFQ